MKFFSFRISSLAILISGIAVVGSQQASSNVGSQRIDPSRGVETRLNRQERPLAYRSPGSRHKLRIPASDTQLQRKLDALGAAARMKRYSDYSLVEVTDAQLSSLAADELERIELRDDFNLVLLERGQLDTTGPQPIIEQRLRQPEGLSRSLNIVQLFGPPTTEALAAVKATGAQVVSYVPNNAYLVWTTRAQLNRIRAMRRQGQVVQWEGPYHPLYKLDPRIKIDSVEQVPFSIVMVQSDTTSQAVGAVKAAARRVLVPEHAAADAVHLKINIEAYKLVELAQIPEVMNIEPYAQYRLHDERANQIAAGSLSFETVSSVQIARPTSPGYLNFLASLGINADLDVAVDVGDTGFDRGTGDPALVHPDFLNAAGASRIAYVHDFSGDPHGSGHDPMGHGTINASIIGGLNTESGDNFRDSLGFQFGLGVAPFVRIGSSKLFSDGGNFGFFAFSDYLAPAHRNGARVSSNSWGACEDLFCNLYTVDSQAFDALVRDCDPGTPGNQQMVLVFSAGNEGQLAGESISSPGTSKNVITVGASENFRGNAQDACGLGPADADNALDVIGFSSRGPVQDGRFKPDIVAPGTHIQGAASQDPLFATMPFNELGVCGLDSPRSRYVPPGQTLYTWSSGTSHSAPIVSGAAALAFQFLKNQLGAEPSAALVKAFLLNSASYLTGRFGGGDLPGTRQGWGLLNMGRMFETTDRIILDESPGRTFTESGGLPFEVTGVVADPSKEFRVMLAWTDPPGDSALNAPFVNQLNLEVTVAGVTYRGNVFNGQYSRAGGASDFVNNVQGVRLPPGTTGTFVIRVRPSIIAGNAIPENFLDLDQDFALVVTNGLEAAVPVLAVPTSNEVAQGVSVLHTNGLTDSSVIPGETAKVTVTVGNLSPTVAASIQTAALSITVGTRTNTSPAVAFSPVPAGGSATNPVPFDLAIPSDLRCGAVASLQLALTTSEGPVRLNVPIRAGRPSGAPTQLLFDDVDSAAVKWKAKKGFLVVSTQAHSGSRSYHVEDPGRPFGDTRLAVLQLKKAITIPNNAGSVRLVFFHIFNFEPGYDGGILEISGDNGTTWEDAGSRILVGGYDGKVTSASNNPLGSQFAWSARGRPGVFSQVVVNLDDFAGRKIKLRFRAGFDEAAGILNGFTGWFIDDIQITATPHSCQ